MGREERRKVIKLSSDDIAIERHRDGRWSVYILTGRRREIFGTYETAVEAIRALHSASMPWPPET